MVRPLVDVLDATFVETSRFVAEWAARLPEIEFVPARDARSLLRALESRRAAAVVIRVADEQSRGFVSELARRYPALALLVLGDEAHSPPSRRSGPTLSVTGVEYAPVERFFRDDVLGAARGSLHGVALSSVVQVLSLERRTCMLRVRSGRRTGAIVVRTGAVVHAEYAGLSPVDAALRIFSWSDSEVAIEPAPTSIEQTIDLPLDYMLLESARRHDEREGEPQATSKRESIAPGPAMVRERDGMLGADSEIARRIIDAAMETRGAIVVQIVDVQARGLVEQRAREGQSAVSATLVATLSEAAFDMTREMERGDWVEDVVIRFSSCFMLLRPLPTSDKLVVCAAFDSKQITVGLASARLAQIVNEACAHA